MAFLHTFIYVSASRSFRFAFVCLSFAFRFAFALLSFARAKRKGFSFSAENRPETKSAFVSETKSLFVSAFRLRAPRFRHRERMRERHTCVRTTNRLMPGGPSSGSRPRSDGGRPQREAAARSPHGRPRPVRSPRAARSPRIRAPTSAPSTAEQQPAPLARIVDFGEWREDFEAASAQRRRRQRDECHQNAADPAVTDRNVAVWKRNSARRRSSATNGAVGALHGAASKRTDESRSMPTADDNGKARARADATFTFPLEPRIRLPFVLLSFCFCFAFVLLLFCGPSAPLVTRILGLESP